MPRMVATPINLSEKQKRILEQFAHGTHTPQHLIERSKIVLFSEQGLTNDDIETKLYLANHTVIKWRNRYNSAAEKLMKAERDTPLKLREEIIKVLSDEQRSGAPWVQQIFVLWK